MSNQQHDQNKEANKDKDNCKQQIDSSHSQGNEEIVDINKQYSNNSNSKNDENNNQLDPYLVNTQKIDNQIEQPQNMKNNNNSNNPNNPQSQANNSDSTENKNNQGNSQEANQQSNLNKQILNNNETNIVNIDAPPDNIEANKINNNNNSQVNNTGNSSDNTNKVVNSEYYNEHNIPKYNEIIDYENQLKMEIELTTPLISEIKDISTLIEEYKDSIFKDSIKEISKKYKFIRYARRDGNCFYRSYLYRLFEHCCINNDKTTHAEVLKKVEGCKDLLEFNGFEWNAIEDFYNVFVNEFKLIMTLSSEDQKKYLEILFSDKEKGNYMIAFVRVYISAYIKENRLIYENFIFDIDLDTWCRREVEPIDIECDNLQIIAVANCFNTGVLIESLGEKKIETMKLPEEGCNRYFTHLFFRPGHYDILYNS